MPRRKSFTLEAFLCRFLAVCFLLTSVFGWIFWPLETAAIELGSRLEVAPPQLRFLGALITLPVGAAFAIGMECLARFLLWQGRLEHKALTFLILSSRWLFGGALLLASGKWLFFAFQGVSRPPIAVLLGSLLIAAFSGVLRKTARLLEESIHMTTELEQIV